MLRFDRRWEEAVVEYGRAIDRLRTVTEADWQLLYSRGIALERSKKWVQAEADFLRALELQPDEALILNYLGYSWVERGENLDRARGMIEKAVDLRPRDGYIVDSLGWVLFQLGDFDEAVRQLERAVSLRPADPVINEHLGDAYWRVGRRLEAKFQWQRALIFEPDEELIPVIEKKLTDGLDDI
jgi:Flp pilus assembly protein TadD